MDFKTLIATRRSVRKFLPRKVESEVVDRLLKTALSAPSSRNARSTHFFVVDNPDLLARIANMRDYGSAFVKDAPLAIILAGDTSKSDLWRENAAIAATMLHLAAVDEGLASCWVHIDGRPCLKADPDGKQAADFLREFLAIPIEDAPFCLLAIGYSDFQPATLPVPEDDAKRAIWINA